MSFFQPLGLVMRCRGLKCLYARIGSKDDMSSGNTGVKVLVIETAMLQCRDNLLEMFHSAIGCRLYTIGSFALLEKEIYQKCEK